MKWMILKPLLLDVVPAVFELPPGKGVAFDRRPLFQQFQVRSLSAMVPSPSIDHDVTLQCLQRSVERLDLQHRLRPDWMEYVMSCANWGRLLTTGFHHCTQAGTADRVHKYICLLVDTSR